MRSVNELQILFPEIKLTTNLVYEWSQAIVSKKQLGEFLKKISKQ